MRGIAHAAGVAIARPSSFERRMRQYFVRAAQHVAHERPVHRECQRPGGAVAGCEPRRPPGSTSCASRFGGGSSTRSNGNNQGNTAYLWWQIASHYSGNPTVAGYDLINEPTGAPNDQAVINASCQQSLDTRPILKRPCAYGRAATSRVDPRTMSSKSNSRCGRGSGQPRRRGACSMMSPAAARASAATG